MSNTPGISPLTPDIEKIRHSDDDDESLIGEDGDLFDDPEAGDDDDEKDVDPDEERDDI